MGTVETMITGLKKVREIAKQMENAELLGQVAELMLEAAELKGRIAEVEDENRQLRERQDLRTKLEYRKWAYFAKDGFTDYGPGPFCPLCFNEHGVLSPLQAVDAYHARCNRCVKNYNPHG